MGELFRLQKILINDVSMDPVNPPILSTSCSVPEEERSPPPEFALELSRARSLVKKTATAPRKMLGKTRKMLGQKIRNALGNVLTFWCTAHRDGPANKVGPQFGEGARICGRSAQFRRKHRRRGRCCPVVRRPHRCVVRRPRRSCCR